MLIDAPLTIGRKEGKTPGTVIFALNVPLLLRSMFDFQSMLRAAPPSSLTVFDLSAVPYMDSAGMGLIMNHYVHCQTRGMRLVVAGANNRVMDLFKITRVDKVLPLVATVEEADA